MGLNNGDADGFLGFNFKVQIIPQEDAEIRLSITYGIDIFFNNYFSANSRSSDC